LDGNPNRFFTGNKRKKVKTRQLTARKAVVCLFLTKPQKTNHETPKISKNVIRQLSIVTRQSPVVIRQSPVAKRQSPVAKRQLPVVIRQLPVVARQLPVVIRQLPIVTRQLPVVARHFLHFARLNASKRYKFDQNCRKIKQSLE
jgi:hypothetical protein